MQFKNKLCEIKANLKFGYVKNFFEQFKKI